VGSETTHISTQTRRPSRRSWHELRSVPSNSIIDADSNTLVSRQQLFFRSLPPFNTKTTEMTTLTPFRLFQLAKYAWARYAPELIPFQSKPNTYNRLKATLQDTSRDGTRKVGFHVEERRGWDSSSSPTPPETSHVTKSVDVRTTSGSGSAATPEQHNISKKAMETVSSPPDPKSPMGGPDKKGGISASENSEIKRLMVDATLWTPDFKAPRNVIVLCHGMSFESFQVYGTQTHLISRSLRLFNRHSDTSFSFAEAPLLACRVGRASRYPWLQGYGCRSKRHRQHRRTRKPDASVSGAEFAQRHGRQFRSA
jgi:hypothetical protein